MLLAPAFILSVIAMLCVPGPTNTLVAASGASAGIRRSLLLVPAEVCGYLISISLLTEAIMPLLARHPALPLIFKLLATLYLVGLALHLWNREDHDLAIGATDISPRKVFLTTLLNPKALIFALIIFPPGDLEARLPAFATFSLIVATIGLFWMSVGHLLARSAGHRATPRRISRITAVALVVFATLLSGSALAPFLASEKAVSTKL